MRFKIWEALENEKAKQLQAIWADTFKALGVGGLSDEDAAQQSLSKITFNNRNPDRTSTFKGKQAVRKRLENGQIFSRLEKMADPDIKKGMEDTRRWLDTQDNEHSANASTTVSVLLQKLFGRYYQEFIDSDMPRVDQAKAQVQPQPPKADPAGSSQPLPATTQPQLPAPGQQQASGQMAMPNPTNPMPPKPAGAEMGLF